MSQAMDRYKVLAAGVLCMIVTIGIARFSYTSLLPIMQAETWLDDAAGGWLAAFNYMGYMVGALLAASVGSLRTKDRLYRLYLMLAVVTTFAMAYTDNMVLWAILRFISGISSSGGMLIASGLILNWLIRHHYRGELGIHFAGAGLGIIFAAAVVEVLVHLAQSWDLQWLWFAVFALVLSIPAWLWMPQPDTRPVTVGGNQLVDRPPSRVFMSIMLVAYFCAGYGYVISATFIVDIVEGQEPLKGLGQWVFMLIGLAVMPAAIIWDRIARALGYLRALMLAYGIQVIGIVLPALTDTLTGALLSALFYGGTFIGCVSLVLTMAGRFYPTKPAKLMGKMTLAYGVAQIVAPALTGMLARENGNYDLGLFLAGGFIALGTLLIGALYQLERREQNLVEQPA
ncbi:YbfB/YjiJ family MFS transporter [Pontibacterium granulatum]|uniref:YbfB/YjiJ family MFS transporter n=1 Tax=Pontibacterium granulatum TaxID=2036029 RepID=UPI00249A5DDC|nr:YbfB/YjiJ family MFS transporter [Pontibacterium granulatum]MDI3325130.1 YbfB/YjiJ family MFS transporter [Pontibacterium granulatum]